MGETVDSPAMDQTSRDKLIEMERQLIESARRPLCGEGDWGEGIPSAPGVYAVWHSKRDEIVYVGQTTGLYQRMSDLGRWRNHTCRRKLGVALGHDGSDERRLSAKLARE